MSLFNNCQLLTVDTFLQDYFLGESSSSMLFAAQTQLHSPLLPQGKEAQISKADISKPEQIKPELCALLDTTMHAQVEQVLI